MFQGKGIIMKPVLQVRDLCRNRILHNISFDLMPGELLAVMGPSGSGKSTLLYNTAGLDQADAGEVRLQDTVLTALSEDDKARLRLEKMGFVFQQMNTIPGLSLEENIVLPGIQAQGKRQKAKVKEKARRLMKELGLEGLETRQAQQVSGGQLQRACICRSLINDPVVLFADEPTGDLNRQAAQEVMDTLVNLDRQGMSILMVTHDSKTASRCDRILYLQDGEIKDQLHLERDDADREQRVNDWLMQRGW